MTDVITHAEARRIAADWHSGQTSDMYALSSSGAIGANLWSEAEYDREHIKDAAADTDHYSLWLWINRVFDGWDSANPEAEGYPDWLYLPGEYED